MIPFQGDTTAEKDCASVYDAISRRYGFSMCVPAAGIARDDLAARRTQCSWFGGAAVLAGRGLARVAETLTAGVHCTRKPSRAPSGPPIARFVARRPRAGAGSSSIAALAPARAGTAG